MLRSLKRLGSLLTPRQRWQAAALVLLLLGNTLLEMVGIGLVPVYIGILAEPDRILANPRVVQAMTALGVAPDRLDQRALLYGGSALLALIFTIKLVYTPLLAYVRARYVQSVVRSQSVRLFEAYLQAPYEFHLRRNSSELIRNITAECTRLGETVLSPLVAMVSQLLITLGIVVLLVVSVPGVAMAAILALAIVIVPLVAFVTRRIKRLSKTAAEGRKRVLRATQEGLGGVKELTLLGRRDFFVARFRSALNGVLALQRYLQVQQVGMPAFMEWTAVVAVLTVVVILFRQTSSPADLLATVALFAVAMARLRGSVTAVLSNYAQVRSGAISVDVVQRDFAVLAGLDSARRGAGLPGDDQRGEVLVGDIRLQDVWFKYAGSTDYALKCIDLVIRRGEAIGFVGPSGGGKSTLMDVILGVLRPERGSVEVAGHDIFCRLPNWRRAVGYVPQSIFLIDGSIRKNIALGLEDGHIDDAVVTQAVSAAGLDEFVASLPNGVETTIGERGVRLSGGQRQRIAIARALYQNPEVLFMDEATSALDNLTEKAVMDAVENLKGQRTVLIIAHRLSTVRGCDRIVFMHDGAIQGVGTYDELMVSHSHFRRLSQGGT